MDDVNTPAVTELHEERSRRVSRAVAARRRLNRAPFPARRGGERSRAGDDDPSRAGGRLWVNGIEMGGTDPRHSPLALSYD
jgi:hypothetical protein